MLDNLETVELERFNFFSSLPILEATFVMLLVSFLFFVGYLAIVADFFSLESFMVPLGLSSVLGCYSGS